MFKALYARTIWIMGISFSLIVLSVGLFRYWLPGNEDARMRVENYIHRFLSSKIFEKNLRMFVPH